MTHDQHRAQLLTLEEAADFLRMSRSSLYQNKHHLPRHRIPGTRRWLFDKDELLAYIKRNSEENSKGRSGAVPSADPELSLAVSKRPAYRKNPKYSD